MDMVDSLKKDIVEIAQSATEIGQRANELYTKGSSDGYTKGYSEGKQAEYDEFWDIYMNKGNLTGDFARYMFAYPRWKNKNFRPKYDIVFKSGASAAYLFWESGIINLKQLLKEQGKTMDFSKVDVFQEVFDYSVISHIPTIDISTSTAITLTRAFANNQNLEEIEKLVINENQKFNGSFAYCTSLKTFILEGTLGTNGLDVKSSPLRLESLRSIISCLKDYSTYTGSTVWKVTVGSTNLAKLTEDDLTQIQEKGWQFV